MHRVLVLAALALVLATPVAEARKAKLTPEQRVNRLWRKVDVFYGQDGAATPQVRFGSAMPSKGVKATTTHGSSPVIDVSPHYTRLLSSRKPWQRRQVRRGLLHEFAHAALPTLDESVASQKSREVRRALNKDQAQRLKRKRSGKPKIIDRGYLKNKPTSMKAQAPR